MWPRMKSERSRILQLLTVDSPAGTELSTYRLVNEMKMGRFDSDVAFLIDRGELSRVFAASGIRVHDLGGTLGVTSSLLKLAALARSRVFDIVHIYGFKAGIIGRLVFAAASPSTIVVQGIRGLHLTQTVNPDSAATRVALWTERRLSFLIDHYVANSKGAMRFLSSKGLPAEKLHWIPSGVDPRAWPVSQRSDRSTSVIACVARFVPVKRHIDLIQALGLLMQAGVPFRCALVGEGPLLRGIQSKVEEVGLGEFITFPGRINPDAVRELLIKADLFVLPSAWEGLPSSVMEAMAAGLPVVGTDVNGISELVVDGETGLLVPPENPESLAAALASMLEDPALRREMGLNGRKRVEAHFDLRKTARQIEQFYESILSPNVG